MKTYKQLINEMVMDRKKVKGHDIELHQVYGGGRAIYHKKSGRILYSHTDNKKVMDKWKGLSEDLDYSLLENVCIEKIK